VGTIAEAGASARKDAAPRRPQLKHQSSNVETARRFRLQHISAGSLQLDRSLP
jgi:hypothetical protein